MSTESSPLILPHTLRVNKRTKKLALFWLILLWLIVVAILASSVNVHAKASVIWLVIILSLFYSLSVPFELSLKIVLDEDCIKFKTIGSEEKPIRYENIKQIATQKFWMCSGTYLRIELFDYPYAVKYSKYIDICFIGKVERNIFLKVIVEKNPKVLLDYSSKLMLEGKY